MKYIASCSFGKDSMAMIHELVTRGEPIDEVLYCKVMFDKNLSGEIPEHEEWIQEVGIPVLQRRYGLKVVTVQAPFSFYEYFYQVKQRGPNKGSTYGFPGICLAGGWCNSRLKMAPINQYLKSQGDISQYVGIAYDEPKRYESLKKRTPNARAPLCEYGITEEEAKEICRENGILSPVYEKSKRLGCWFCNLSNLSSLRMLYRDYPDLWNKLQNMECDSPYSFKPDYTLFDLAERFRAEQGRCQ